MRSDLPLPTPPPGMFYFGAGLIVRRHGWLAPGARLVCPIGHTIDEPWDLREGVGTYRCRGGRPASRSPQAGQRTDQRCPAQFYVLAVAVVGKTGRWVADVNDADMEHMEQQGMSPSDVFAYLGASFPNRRTA
jgi:hypothetical protein